ncbi:MAG: tRNA (N6-isopentenyl adenosine(37)-C2)-methylthiotransferase MiaB [Thermodesulfobacteriota bacterium]
MVLTASCEKRVFIETFGCQMNDSDTDTMLGILEGIDYRETLDPTEADLILVNTCSVRDKAEQKVYSTVGRYKTLKRERPGLRIAITGCVAQQRGESLLKRLPYIDFVLGPHNLHRISDILNDLSKQKSRISETSQITDVNSTSFKPRAFKKGQKKALVSIMRGCDNFCTYCIVPFTRGREESRDSTAIVKEISALAEAGIKEVTLLGQNVNSYRGGKGGGGGAKTFTELLKEICRVDGIERVRFVTSHPKDISTELIELFAVEEKLCRHLHLPMQSGSDRVLAMMKRGYTSGEYLEKVGRLKELYPLLALTTDMIVGFPGETDADFERTMAVISDVEFDNIFSFKYSPRPETRAAALPDRVSEEVKSRRLSSLQASQREITIRRNEAQVGRTLEIYIEGRSKLNEAELTGRSGCNRIVNFPGPPELAGTLADVLITGARTNSLRGEQIERKLLCS